VDHPTPSVVNEAIRALAPFRVTSRRDAARLLAMWRHVEALTPAQRVAVLDHYAPVRPGVLRVAIDRQARTGAAWLERRDG